MRQREAVRFGWVLVTAAVLAGCGGGERRGGTGGETTTAARAGGESAGAPGAAAAAASACPGGSAGLTLPAGFCATIFADSVGEARHVTVAPNGDVFVALQATEPSPEERAAGERQQPQQAAVIALRDTSRDGRADVIARIPGTGNTGIGIHAGRLYVDEGHRIVRWRLSPDSLAPAGKPEVVVSGIPLQPGHVARNFVIGADGALFLNVGSATNSCQRKDRTTGSPGVDPCTELRTRAGIWRFDANELNQRFTPEARWATGIRNTMGIAYGPDGKLYATQHGRDQFYQNWAKIFPDPKYSAENPAEELVQVNQHDDFGWPYCYYAMDQKKLVDAPEYGGDGKKTDRCASKKGPVAVFPAHWAPMSLLFYSGTQFPARYRNGAFIAMHGSWNRAPEPQEGYRVVFQPLKDGQAGGEFETFANGFADEPPARLQPGNAKHRPVGLAQGPDGALYVTDDAGGRVYRITYTGGK
ncbi:MAG TPA: PQQ-dependent sugar dehydrogenase [Gemmatimonadales bacterium]|nr:PQQ-dependent sugar dehydrogenase [Gemmatimonadales bacterium]